MSDDRSEPRRLAIRGGDPIRDTYLPFGRPSVGEEEIRHVSSVLRSGWIGMGGRTSDFEEAFADYVGADQAVAVSSCTAALHLTLLALGVGPGDEVITSALTFAATLNAIMATGARPVAVDVDRETFNIDIDSVRRAIRPATKAILAVDFGGLPCDLAGLSELSTSTGTALVEDAAHAVGAIYDGRRVGGHGHAACFSFYPNKNMTTGEGGMVTTSDAGVAERVRILRLHGLSADAWRRYESKELIVSTATELGFKYNMTDIQAALGLGQLARLEDFLAAREAIARTYDEAFADLPVRRQRRDVGRRPVRHGLHLYVLLVEIEKVGASRNEIVKALRAENIGVAMHYAPLHEHPLYHRELGCRKGDHPNAEWIAERTITLPMGPFMEDRDVTDVVTAVRSVLRHYEGEAR